MASSSLNIYTVNIKIWLMLVLDITEMWIERDIVTVLTMANKKFIPATFTTRLLSSPKHSHSGIWLQCNSFQKINSVLAEWLLLLKYNVNAVVYHRNSHFNWSAKQFFVLFNARQTNIFGKRKKKQSIVVGALKKNWDINLITYQQCPLLLRLWMVNRSTRCSFLQWQIC